MTVLYLVRHGETDWSRTGRYTSITDVDLTPAGREEAVALRDRLDPADFGLALCSPRRRALTTARLAGFSPLIDEDLAEWFYGEFEGLVSSQIDARAPGWKIWKQPLPGGESAAELTKRLRRVIDRVRRSEAEQAICFSHGHALRALALLWAGVPLEHGEAFPLGTGSLSVLGYEKQSPAIIRWNL